MGYLPAMGFNPTVEDGGVGSQTPDAGRQTPALCVIAWPHGPRTGMLRLWAAPLVLHGLVP